MNKDYKKIIVGVGLFALYLAYNSFVSIDSVSNRDFFSQTVGIGATVVQFADSSDPNIVFSNSGHSGGLFIPSFTKLIDEQISVPVTLVEEINVSEPKDKSESPIVLDPNREIVSRKVKLENLQKMDKSLLNTAAPTSELENLQKMDKSLLNTAAPTSEIVDIKIDINNLLNSSTQKNILPILNTNLKRVEGKNLKNPNINLPDLGNSFVENSQTDWAVEKNYPITLYILFTSVTVVSVFSVPMGIFFIIRKILGFFL